MSLGRGDKGKGLRKMGGAYISILGEFYFTEN